MRLVIQIKIEDQIKIIENIKARSTNNWNKWVKLNKLLQIR